MRDYASSIPQEASQPVEGFTGLAGKGLDAGEYIKKLIFPEAPLLLQTHSGARIIAYRGDGLAELVSRRGGDPRAEGQLSDLGELCPVSLDALA